MIRQGQTADFLFQPCLPRLDLYWVNTAPSRNMFSLIYTLFSCSALPRSPPWPLPLLLCQAPLSPSFASLATVCHLFGGFQHLSLPAASTFPTKQPITSALAQPSPMFPDTVAY